MKFGPHTVTLDDWRNAAHALHDELESTRALLNLRSAALNRTGQQNDQLRATAAACKTCRHSLNQETP